MTDLNKIPQIADLIIDAHKILFSITSDDSPEERQVMVAEAMAYLEIAKTIITWDSHKLGRLRG